MKGSEVLKKKYNLQSSEEVESAAKRTEKRTGEKVSSKPAERIQNYLDRFSEILNRENTVERQRGIEAIKRIIHSKFIIKSNDIPESYWKQQQRMARELGHGDLEVSDELKEQQAEVIIADQESSLDNWIDYLVSDDATYPDWLKYWAIRSVLAMGEYDKDKKSFTKRDKGTVKPFPDLNREALAMVLDAVQKKYKGENIDLNHLSTEDQEEFGKLLKEEGFAKLYAWAVGQLMPASESLLVNTQGRWSKYPKGSDHMPLVKSLQKHSTGWCTAGESTARTQLDAGDFYVYYSSDESGKPTIPRAAIRMQGGSIGEVRGIAKEQNLDPYIGEVVQKKMHEFPDGAEYEKKATDMKQLTSIENKTKLGQQLTKDDLVFLYEIEKPIQGFGYQKDPRIAELRNQRDPQKDAPIVFECSPEQIAFKVEDITKDTKAYIGAMTKGIFEALPKTLEHIYTKFPEGRIVQKEIEIGGKNEKELEKEILAGGNKFYGDALPMMQSDKFETLKKVEKVNLVILSVADMGFPNGATTKEIYSKIEELGLEIVPDEIGPQLRIQYTDQPMDEYLVIGMKPLPLASGPPRVFFVRHDDYGRYLHYDFAFPADRWRSDDRWVFRRK